MPYYDSKHLSELLTLFLSGQSNEELNAIMNSMATESSGVQLKDETAPTQTVNEVVTFFCFDRYGLPSLEFFFKQD